MKTITYQTPNQDSVFASLSIRKNPDEAFQNAIQMGMRYPEEWMYMYSKNGYDYFKHSDTRRYCRYPQSRFLAIATLICCKAKNIWRKKDEI